MTQTKIALQNSWSALGVGMASRYIEDTIKIPENIPSGEYVLGFRWLVTPAVSALASAGQTVGCLVTKRVHTLFLFYFIVFFHNAYIRFCFCFFCFRFCFSFRVFVFCLYLFRCWFSAPWMHARLVLVVLASSLDHTLWEHTLPLSTGQIQYSWTHLFSLVRAWMVCN